VVGWYFHQFHPLFLRIGVIFALLVEVPLTFLLLSPFQFTRRVGVVAQAFLQIFIMLTGNYNFFNLLTLALLIPVWYSDFPSDMAPPRQKMGSVLSTLSTFFSVHWLAQLLLIIALSVYSFLIMFDASILPIDSHSHHFIDRIVLEMKSSFQIDYYTQTGCLFALGSCGISLGFNALAALYQYIYRLLSLPSLTQRLTSSIRFIFVLLSIIFTVIYIQFSALHLNGIHVDLKPYVLPQVVVASSNPAISSMSLFSGYGLFRTMVGVGQLNETERLSVFHVGGRAPSIVARNEIVLEGYDLATEQWITIPFKYLPSHTTRTPQWIFPHQPRLDWHMGFAAHGSYQHHPWFISLIYRLLQGNQSSVIDLLDEKQYPFLEHPPLLIRSLLYEYDLTRLDNYWNRNIPSAQILENETLWSPLVHSLNKSEASFHWWQRKRLLGEYMIPLHLSNPSMKTFLEANGYHFRDPVTLTEEISQCQLSSSSSSSSSSQLSPDAFDHRSILDNTSQRICDLVFHVRVMLTGNDLWRGFYSIGILMIFQILTRSSYR
jgi:hypothetical protein